MFVNCFHVFSLSALLCRKPENAQVPPSFPVVGLVFLFAVPKAARLARCQESGYKWFSGSCP